ncbi:MAG: hypothetical protein IKJ42_04995 [Bacteroidaceae bacterium]|nr:hypothetical protein [Bacteroidaceae bacterium]
MRKFTKMFFALALTMCCAMSANAGKKVLLSSDFEDGNVLLNGWGNNQTRDVVDGAFHVNNPSAVQSWESQIAYDFNDPFLPNNEYTLTCKIRGSAAGQITFGLQNADDSYKSVGEFGTIDFDVDWVDVRVTCLCNGEGGKRFIASIGTFEGDIYIDDLELSVWTDQETVETGANPALRWENILVNSDLEGTENISFYTRENDSLVADSLWLKNALIQDGVGKDGSRGIKMVSYANAAQDWDAQFFIALQEPLSEGVKYRVQFDYRASTEVTASTQAHRNPTNYIHYDMIGSPAFTTDWQTYIKEGTLSSSQAGSGTFQSIAFNLSVNRDENVDFYFDNLTFELANNGLIPQCSGEVVLLDMARTTNISALVAAGGKKRLILPEGVVTVTINGQPVEAYSVELLADGRFYAFIDGEFNPEDDIQVTFTNSTDPAYQIIYTDDNTVVPDFQGKGLFNQRVSEVDGAIPDELAAPEAMTIDPGADAFNLPVSFNTINITFDKAVSCDDLKAYLGSEGLAVEPATGYAETIKLVRTKTDDLAEGEYQVNITDIHSEIGAELDEYFWGAMRYTINIGQNIDSLDVVVDLTNMIQQAEQKREANITEDGIYSGTVLDNLKAAIDKVKAEYKTWTSPNAFKNAQKELNGLMVEMDAHHTLVDNYYAAINGAISAVDTYAGSKFAGMAEYATLQKGVLDYVNDLGEIKKIYDDAELQAAVDAIKPIVDSASKYFTEGPSKYGTTGIAALVERIRLGAEALKALGVSEEDELIKAANNALTDDDNLATQIKLRLKAETYKALSEGKAETLFASVYDDNVGDFVASTVDMTVFYKNPNIYISNTEVGGGLGEGAYNEEYMPGWTVPEGAITPKYAVGTYNVAAPHLIADGTFLQWQSAFQIEQAVIDLPVGTYTIKSSFSERTGTDMESVFYVTVSNTNPGEFAAVDSVENKGDRPTDDLYLSVEGIQVTDGYLNVGVKAGAAACCHFNAISVQMAGTIEGFNYAEAYKEAQAEYDAFVSGIEGTVITSDVEAFELYDLSGRRINKAQQGVVIIKKYMTDGTVVTEKVVKK